MSYEKQTWATGDIITAEKLNHMEDGIAGGGGDIPHLTVHFNVEKGEPTLKNNFSLGYIFEDNCIWNIENNVFPASWFNYLSAGQSVDVQFMYFESENEGETVVISAVYPTEELTASGYVNCDVEVQNEMGGIVITDPSQNSEVTLTYNSGK